MVGYLKSVTIRQIGQLEALLQQQAKHAGYQTNSIVGVLAIMLIYGFFILQWRRNQVQKLTRNLSVHNQELSAKTEVLQELNRRLSHKNSAMEEFTRIVSHNLRAPAATLMSLAQVMAISSDAEEIKEYGRLTKKVAANLNNSFEELMTVMQAGSETQTLEQVSFEDTLERVMLNTATQINETQAKVETDFSIVPQILYSRLYLESIIQNLLTNAIKYRHPDRNPVIKLSTYLKNQRVHLSVKDNGLGIDLKQYGDKLFGLYQTFHGSQQSRGVGLYLTRSHVRAQGGDIMVQSTPDMGTEFIIMF
jgi:signal transduction histidine kinase